MSKNQDLYVNALLANRGNIRLAFFDFVARTKITSIGQTQTVEITIPGNDFLLRDIEIHAYDKWGSLYGVGFAPRDRFTFMMKNVSTGENYFSRAKDVMNFSPIVGDANRITPDIIKANSTISFEIYHEPIVTDSSVYALAPLVDVVPDGDGNPPRGVEFEINLKGSKLFSDPNSSNPNRR